MGESIRQQLDWASGVLNTHSCSSRLDSEILLAHCLGRDRAYLMTWPERELEPQQLDCFRDLVRKRLQPQPVAYLIGSREFYSMMLKTTPDTLVPRPETELLVEKTLELSHEMEQPKILELGTGTGAIVLAIKQHCPGCRVTATDISEQALQVARENAESFRLEVDFLLSDWYQAIPPQRYDLIVSNPPYIAAADPYLGQGDLPAEPQQALCSGESGLEALQVIIDGASDYLGKDGWIVLEHGWDQAEPVREMLQSNGFSHVQLIKDFNQLPRLTRAQLAA